MNTHNTMEEKFLSESEEETHLVDAHDGGKKLLSECKKKLREFVVIEQCEYVKPKTFTEKLYRKWMSKKEDQRPVLSTQVIDYIEEFADLIRCKSNFYKEGQAVPVVKIAKFLNLSVIKTPLDNQEDGHIYSGGTTKDVYGVDPVIIVSNKIPLAHQRFIIAHEIGHYIFDYLADKKYDNPNHVFSRPYITPKDHNNLAEQRADCFAAELLMPRKIFIEEYKKAMKCYENVYLVNMYLASFFATKESSIIKRKSEVGISV